MHHFETMWDKIGHSINQLIIESWGGLLAFWTVIVLTLGKFFSFIGKCAAKGLISELVAAIVPTFENKMEEKLKPIRDALSIYKEEKHAVEGELKSIKEVILSDDKEILKELRILIRRENVKNKQHY